MVKLYEKKKSTEVSWSFGFLSLVWSNVDLIYFPASLRLAGFVSAYLTLEYFGTQSSWWETQWLQEATSPNHHSSTTMLICWFWFSPDNGIVLMHRRCFLLTTLPNRISPVMNWSLNMSSDACVHLRWSLVLLVDLCHEVYAFVSVCLLAR